MSAAFDYDTHRFAIGGGGTSSGTRWHAVDLESLAPRMALVREKAHGEGRKPAGMETFSACGVKVQLLPAMEPFAHDSALLTKLRCERCSWVVAIDRGTIEQEIALYVADAGEDPRGELLRQIFTAILADTPPGQPGQADHRSDLLAHAALHRPRLTVCQCCTDHGCRAAHGPTSTSCPHREVRCLACSFTAGPWANEREGSLSGECTVISPCSTLLALAAHYDVALPGVQGRR